MRHAEPHAPSASEPLFGLEAIYAQAPVALCVLDREARFVVVNEKFALILGKPVEAILGHSIEDIAPLAAAIARQDLARAIEGLPIADREISLPETGRNLLVTMQPIHGADGNVIGLSVALVDITEQARMGEALARAEQRASFALQNAGQWIWELDIPSNRVRRSPHWKALLGFEEDESAVIDEEMAWRVIHPADREAADRALQRVLSGERKMFEATYRIRHKNGRWLWILSRGTIVDTAPDGSPLRFLATSVDITRQKTIEEELAATVRQRKSLEQELIRANRRLTTLSEIDSLTELPNRRKFDKMLDREFRRTKRHHPSMALLMIDVDHFKHFNDLYGHQAGDECLRNVAETLRQTVQRTGDIVARYGGEEFAAILSDTDEAGATEVAERMLATMRALGVAHAGSPYGTVTVSIGLTAFAAHIGNDPATPQYVLRAADRALYAAKDAGRNRIATGRMDGNGTIRVAVLTHEPAPSSGDAHPAAPAP